jgi:hypothetical protein
MFEYILHNMVIQVRWSAIILYTEQNVIDNVKEQAGVYRLSESKNEKKIVFYVGKSDQLQTRLLQHLSNEELNPCIKKKVKGSYFRFGYLSEQNLDCAERYLYDYYSKPECNIQEPKSKPCEINIE